MFQFYFYVYKLICQKSRRSEADRPLQSFPKIFSTIAFSSSGYSSHCQGHYCLYNGNALQLQQEKKCFSISGYQIGNISVARQWRLTSSHTFRMVLIWFVFRDDICPTICVFPQGKWLPNNSSQALFLLRGEWVSDIDEFQDKNCFILKKVPQVWWIISLPSLNALTNSPVLLWAPDGNTKYGQPKLEGWIPDKLSTIQLMEQFVNSSSIHASQSVIIPTPW